MFDPKLPDPGQPPFCSHCGAPAAQALAVPPGSLLGVCRGCGSVCQVLVSGRQPLPFLEKVSELDPRAAQVRAAFGRS